jgi:hypothetical protein
LACCHWLVAIGLLPLACYWLAAGLLLKYLFFFMRENIWLVVASLFWMAPGSLENGRLGPGGRKLTTTAVVL